LIPVEVKLGKSGRLRSLMEYMDLCPHHLAVRIYSGVYREEIIKTLKGKEFVLINLPFYLAAKMKDYIKKHMTENT
ncbi:MAG: AAA family ATPase, partial [Bacteroidales bacterium]|nr:AAA family ATPase [Bacteroidales bacterium]